MGEKYWPYQDTFIGNANILAVQAMLQGSLQWTIGTQVMLAPSPQWFGYLVPCLNF